MVKACVGPGTTVPEWTSIKTLPSCLPPLHKVWYSYLCFVVVLFFMGVGLVVIVIPEA